MPVVRVGTATAPDGALLSWRADGEGPLALIACNGLGVATLLWRGLAHRFAATHTFVTWDYRGQGKSPLPEGPENVTVALCARDLWTVADRAGVGRAVLLGYSIGTQVILEALRQDPGRPQALIPVLGAAGNVFASFPGGARLAPVLRLLIELGASNAGLAGRALKALVRVLPKQGFEPGLEQLAQLDLRGCFALARDLLSHDASDLLEQIRVPTLVIAGERDRLTPLARSREMAERIPGAEILILREGTHAALSEQPELVALSVEKFLRAHALA